MSQNKQSEFLKVAFEARTVLTAYAYSILKDWGLAQDIFQEAVISMNEKAEDIQKDSPIAWLKRVIKNKAIDTIRKQKRTNNHHEQFILIIDKKFDALLSNEKIEVYQEKEKALQNCMAKLEPQTRQIILGFYKDKSPCQALGDLFNRSTNAVRLLLSRSRSQLRHCVKKQLSRT